MMRDKNVWLHTKVNMNENKTNKVFEIDGFTIL